MTKYKSKTGYLDIDFEFKPKKSIKERYISKQIDNSFFGVYSVNGYYVDLNGNVDYYFIETFERPFCKKHFEEFYDETIIP